MFEFLAFLFVAGIVCAAFVGALAVVFGVMKFVLTIVLLPFKLLYLPLLAIGFVVKVAVLAAIAITVLAVLAAAIVPLLIFVGLIAVPVAVIGALA